MGIYTKLKQTYNRLTAECARDLDLSAFRAFFINKNAKNGQEQKFLMNFFVFVNIGLTYIEMYDRMFSPADEAPMLYAI